MKVQVTVKGNFLVLKEERHEMKTPGTEQTWTLNYKALVIMQTI